MPKPSPTSKNLQDVIAAKRAKRAAIRRVYAQLADQPVRQLKFSYWTGLIDHATINTHQIGFTFKTGQTITILWTPTSP